MKEVLIEQYSSIQQTIKLNLSVIRQLVQQAESLRRIVDGISGDASAKSTLEGKINDIESTIGQLLDQTDALFNQYQRFVDRVFSGK